MIDQDKMLALVERLLNLDSHLDGALKQAADDFTALLKENERLRAALNEIDNEYDPSECGTNAMVMWEIAREALKGSDQ